MVQPAVLRLENIVGSLLQSVQQAEPGSWRTSAEITTERLTNPGLRNLFFWPANFALYKVEKGEAVLYFGGRESNIIFGNVEEATSQLIKTDNYVPKRDGIDAVVASVNSGNTLRVELSGLGLKKHDDEYSYFEIDTSHYDELNASQRSLAESVYGSGNDFEKNMGMLAGAQIAKTRIRVLNPDYVKSKVKGDSAVARACWLGGFHDGSDLYADDRNFNNGYLALRGVHRKVVAAEGGGAQKPLVVKPDPFSAAYKTVVGSPDKLTPDMAAGLSNLLAAYLTQREQ